MFYNNINGFASKKHSLAKIVEDINPDIFALCETKKSGRIKKDEFKAYNILERNLKQGQEGLMIGVKEGSFKSIREVTDTELMSIMTVKIVYPALNLRVIVAHAPQENAKSEERLEFFEELSVQIERAVTSDEETIIVGDFNARISGDLNAVSYDKDSPNGKQLSELIEKHCLKVGNFHPDCQGKWTRIQVGKKGEVKRSALDYVLLPKLLCNSLTSIEIDEEKIYCPYREKKAKGKIEIVHSDHCSIIVDMLVETGLVKKCSGKKSTWHFSEEGYSSHQVESEAPLNFNVKAATMTGVYSSWTEGFEKLLAKSFRKRTFKEGSSSVSGRKHTNIRRMLSKLSRKGRIQREVAKVYQVKMVEIENRMISEARAKRLKRTVSQLTIGDKFSPMAYWKMKNAANKNTRKPQDLSSIIKPNGVEVDGNVAIKEAYQEEFEIRLSNRKPAHGWEQYTEATNIITREWLKGESVSSPPFKFTELEKVVSELKGDSSSGVDNYPPKVFKTAGKGLLQSILQLVNEIKSRREFPQQWDLVRIVTIYKRKGSKKKLKYYRGIFLTIIISKIFEKLVKSRIEIKLKRINVLQAGSRKNRGPPDNTFLLRGVIDHFKFTKRTLFITAYDFEQAFDSLWLEDCVLSLRSLGVEKEYLQLIYNMNKQASVTVQTPCGVTNSFETDPIVKQGTVLGPTLCSSSTGEYTGQNIGVNIADVIISSLIYVDDIIDLSSSVQDYLRAHQNALHFTARKKLGLSGTKCFSMAVNKKPEVTLPVLKINEIFKVLESMEIIYLGDVFNNKGNNDGLIADRIKRGTKAMIAISSLMAETDVGIHHVSIMLLLYSALFLSTILFNSQSWSNLRAKDLDSLRTLQLKFLKRIVGVAISSANAFVFLELGVLPIDFEIEKRQLMYLHRILQLEESDPVRMAFHAMTTLHEAGEKNWWTGVVKLLSKYDLSSDLEEIREMSKDSFSAKVKMVVSEKALVQLIAECKSLKKTEGLEYESLATQDYLLQLYPSQARIVFKWRSKTIDIKSHSTHKYKDLICRSCKCEEEDPAHVINCGREVKLDKTIDVSKIGTLDEFTKSELKQMVSRITLFLEEVS